MAAATKPLELARPFRTGLYFGLGLFVAWLILGVLAWIASFVLGLGPLGAAAFGLGGDSTTDGPTHAIERGPAN